MEESINPTINVGPVTFDLTLLAMTLLTVLVTFGFVYWASRKMTIKPSRKQNALKEPQKMLCANWLPSFL